MTSVAIVVLVFNSEVNRYVNLIMNCYIDNITFYLYLIINSENS